MKIKKRIAALLAVAMVAALMPMTAFGASRNRVDKTITVAENSIIEKGDEPTLSIKLDDKLTTTQSFYLELDGAEWLPVADLISRVDKGALDTNTPVDDNRFTFDVTFGTSDEATQTFEGYREDGTTLAIRLLGDDNVIEPKLNPNENFEFTFPMATKVTGGEASVAVRMYDTTISKSKDIFALSNAKKAIVEVGDAPAFYRTTEIAGITLEETYAKSLKSVPQEQRWFTIELRDSDFTFNVTDAAKFKGARGYRGVDVDLAIIESYELSNDRTRLGIKITDETLSTILDERGKLALSGIEVVAARDARDGEVKAVIDGNKLFDKETIVIAKRGDYKTTLAVDEDWDFDVVAGNKKEVTFTLTEELANSLIGTRPATFTFDNDVIIDTEKTAPSDVWKDWKADDILWGDIATEDVDTIKALVKAVEEAELTSDVAKIVDAKIALYQALKLYTPQADAPGKPGNIALNAAIKGFEITGSADVGALDKDEWSKQANKPLENRVHIADNKKSFTVDNFNLIQDKAGVYTFTVPVIVPANVEGEVTVAVAGKGVTEESIKILDVVAPITVTGETANIKVGLKEIITEATITITETAEERLHQGKNIVIKIDDQDHIIDSGMKITSFDVEVTEGDLVLGDRDGNTIPVKRVSTEASTIEITNIVMSTDRTVPEGKYDLLVGGPAVSNVGGFVKPVKEFINITTKNTEDIEGSSTRAEVKFTVGMDKYIVNGEEVVMDAPAFITDGNTMVPIRYVSKALGITEDKVLWSSPEATILADKVIQVALGSKAMNINGVSVPMTAAAELVDDRTFVPMGAIARALNVEVVWDNDTKTATFNPAK